jgi:hypothetical protein
MKTLMGIFFVTGSITHVWTVIIAFQESGFWGGIISLVLPVLSELYWIFKMLGENNTYVVIAVIHTILALLFVLVSKSSE